MLMVMWMVIMVVMVVMVVVMVILLVVMVVANMMIHLEKWKSAFVTVSPTINSPSEFRLSSTLDLSFSTIHRLPKILWVYFEEWFERTSWSLAITFLSLATFLRESQVMTKMKRLLIPKNVIV